MNNASITRYGDAVGLVNFPGPDADGSATAFASGFQIFDNGDAEKLQVARDFLSFVYGDGHWLDYAAGAIPASKRVSDRYGADIPFYDLFRANAGNVWDFTGNNPDTQTVREIFYTGIHDLLMGKTTPEECAACESEEEEQIIEDEPAPAEEAAEEEIEEEPIKLRGETKICPVCKAEVDGDALFCNHCGAQL